MRPADDVAGRVARFVGVDGGLNPHCAIAICTSKASSRMRRSKYRVTIAVATNGVVIRVAIVFTRPCAITIEVGLPPRADQKFRPNASAALRIAVSTAALM